MISKHGGGAKMNVCCEDRGCACAQVTWHVIYATFGRFKSYSEIKSCYGLHSVYCADMVRLCLSSRGERRSAKSCKMNYQAGVCCHSTEQSQSPAGRRGVIVLATLQNKKTWSEKQSAEWGRRRQTGPSPACARASETRDNVIRLAWTSPPAGGGTVAALCSRRLTLIAQETSDATGPPSVQTAPGSVLHAGGHRGKSQ